MKKKFRKLKNQEFQDIIKARKSYLNKTFVIYYMNNELSHLRFGLSVGKKLGNAVLRNKIRRQLKSMLQEYTKLEHSQDLVIIVFKNYLNQSYDKNKLDLDSLFKIILKRR